MHPLLSRPFREEALSNSLTKQHSEVLVAQPISYVLLTAFAATVVIVLVFFLFSFSYERKVRVSGVLIPSGGLTQISASQSGLVTAVEVSEGQTVLAGAPLFRLGTDRDGGSGESTDRSIGNLLRKRRASLLNERESLQLQYTQRNSAMAGKVAGLTAENGRIGNQVRIQKERVDVVTQLLRTTEELSQANFVSAAQVKARKSDVLEQQQKLAELEVSRAINTRETNAATAEMQGLALQLRRDQAAVDRSISEMDQEIAENELKREIVIHAPRDGTITAMSLRSGQYLAASQASGIILRAKGDLHAELYAEPKHIGFLSPGAEVQLRYPAFPYQKFGHYAGVIVDITESTLSSDDTWFTQSRRSTSAPANGVYRIRVRIKDQEITAYGQRRQLKPGMTIEAAIVLDRRRLYEWVLDPLIALKGNI